MARARSDELPDFDPRPTVRIHVGMPENESIAGLSDSAFRLMVELICYCGRNENSGRIPKQIAARFASRRGAVRELLEAGHLADDGAEWHLVDYLRWNRSPSEIASFRASRSERGALGAHLRWHVPGRKVDPDCPHCNPSEVPDVG